MEEIRDRNGGCGPVYQVTLLRSTQEIARTFCVSLSTVRKWDEQGAPFVHIGARRFVVLEELICWLRRLSSQPVNPSGSDS